MVTNVTELIFVMHSTSMKSLMRFCSEELEMCVVEVMFTELCTFLSPSLFHKLPGNFRSSFGLLGNFSGKVTNFLTIFKQLSMKL